ALQLRMPARLAHNFEPMLLVRRERDRIVRSDIGEDLFVPLPPCGVEGGRKEAFGNSLSSALEVDIGANHTDMIERAGVRREGRHALEADDHVIAGPHGDMENVAWGESGDIRTLGFDRER